MKINAIGTDYSVLKASRTGGAKVAKTQTQPSGIPQGMSVISFRGGNPRHIAHVVAEEPIFGFNGGGVGTVVNDYNFLDKDVDKIVKLIPLYNQQVEYKENINPKTGKIGQPLPQEVKVRYVPKDLPANHPFKKYEGTPFITGQKIDNSTNFVEFLEKNATKNNVFLLEEVGSSKMDWGLEKDIPIKMFRAKKEGALLKAMNKNGMSKALQDKLEFVFTYVDATASMTKQYEDNLSYSFSNGTDLEKRFSSGWKGQAYPKYNKATVDLLPTLKEKYNIDPKYLLCSDGQSMFTMHYAAQKNAAGDSYWQDKFLGGVGHNMNSGYDQPMGARQAIVNLGATKEEIEKIINSKEYIKNLQLGREDDFLRETVLKNFNKEKGGMTAFHIPIHYATKGYVPMLTTVSEGYHNSIISNDLVSGMYEDLKALDKLGRFKGITNPLMDPNVTPFKDTILQPGYANDVKLKLKDGTEFTVPKFKVFDESKKYDLKHVREIKQYNKINLLERFDTKFIDAQSFDKENNKWLSADTGRMEILAGKGDRKAKVYGNVDKKYLDALKAGKDVKFVISWGRGDFQKGMDTVIESFEKFIEKNPNEDAVLIMGGDMKNEPQTIEKFKLTNLKPNLHGRMIFMDGWAPGKDFAMASDIALLPSRFAPCELTDLEAKKALCTPVVPNVQGMAQKNFDPSIAEEAAKMDGYKGKHEFYMTEETALKAANENAKKEFFETKEPLVKYIKGQYKGKLNKDMPEDLFKKTLENDARYQKALNTLRDSVISDEMADCIERALIKDRNGSIPETILKNQVDADTTWFGNGWLSKTQKSAGELYQEYHFNNKGKNITKDDLIKLDFSELGESIEGKGSGDKVLTNFKGWLKEHKKASIITGGAVLLAGLGYAGYKSGWLSPKFATEEECDKKPGHLSRVI